MPVSRSYPRVAGKSGITAIHLEHLVRWTQHGMRLDQSIGQGIGTVQDGDQLDGYSLALRMHAHAFEAEQRPLRQRSLGMKRHHHACPLHDYR
ncbi:hypothetical protein D3C78_1617030 [compost metagenome]